MSRLRAIVVGLLALVLVLAQALTAVQASAMAIEASAAAVEAPSSMAGGDMPGDDMPGDDMPGDCDGCGTAEAEAGLCSANCCASCSTTAAVMPGEWTDASFVVSGRSAPSPRLSLGLAPSPHLTPPKPLVLG